MEENQQYCHPDEGGLCVDKYNWDLTWVETDTGLLGFGLFKNIVKSNFFFCLTGICSTVYSFLV